MAEAFRELPEAIAHTNLISNGVPSIPSAPDTTPRYDVPPRTLDSYLETIAETGLSARLASHSLLSTHRSVMNATADQLHHHLFHGVRRLFLDRVGHRKCYCPFAARIPSWPWAWVAAGSLVAYALGITELTRLPGLLFERFLNLTNLPPGHRHGLLHEQTAGGDQLCDRKIRPETMSRKSSASAWAPEPRSAM